MSQRRLALLLAGGSAGALIAMVVVSVATGATQEAHEHYHPPAEYATNLLAHAGGLRLIMGIDVAFLVLYTAFFAVLAGYLRKLGQSTWLALGALIAVTVLDILEDHHILGLLSLAENGRPIDDSAIVLQEMLSATKFTFSYLAFFLFGLAVPRTTRLGWVLAIFLTAGTLVTAVVGVASPPSLREAIDGGRWLGFLGGFVLVAIWLRRAED